MANGFIWLHLDENTIPSRKNRMRKQPTQPHQYHVNQRQKTQPTPTSRGLKNKGRVLTIKYCVNLNN